MFDVDETDASAWLVPVTVTLAGEGTAGGAVYNPLDEIVPQPDPEQPAPATVQVTAVFDVPVTVAENCFVVEAVTDAVAGETLMPTTALPVPLNVTVTVPPEESFAILSCPVPTPVVVGSN